MAFCCQILLDYSFAEHEGELGYCVLCEKQILEKKEGFYIRPNSDYREIWVEFSNKSIGRVGLCKEHFDNLTEKDYPKIMEGIKHGWEKEFKIDNWSQEKIDKYKENFFNITITRRLDEKDIEFITNSRN